MRTILLLALSGSAACGGNLVPGSSGPDAAQADSTTGSDAETSSDATAFTDSYQPDGGSPDAVVGCSSCTDASPAIDASPMCIAMCQQLCGTSAACVNACDMGCPGN